ncbi:MAG TPA: glycerophosphodiester phosphodiesterase family protein [Aestuariivirga sp.]|nr:glycerophosphodiester phosphodiesterase family protein [Aestuariivirga sp.]
MRLALDWLVARPIAHRGLHDKAKGVIENSESAFAAAIRHGYPIECDLQITGDGEAVVFHDETLDRVTGDQGPLMERNTAELKRVPFRAGHDRIQTLAELLEQVDGKVPLVIELKSHWDGGDALAARALAVLAAYRGPHGLMSFDPDLVEALRRRSPATARGIAADRADDPYYDFFPPERLRELRNFSHLVRTEPHFVSFDYRQLPFAPVTEFRQAGHPVITWTIKSPEAAAQARRYCDQITFEGFLA